MKIAVLGGLRYIKEIKELFRDGVDIDFWIDNSPHLSGKLIEGKRIYSPYDFPKDRISYIVIFIDAYKVVCHELICLGINKECIINFSDMTCELSCYEKIFDLEIADKIRIKMKLDFMERRICELERARKSFEQNYIYEVADLLQKRSILLPHIYDVAQTCEKLLVDQCSMSRYGDGEFEIIFGHAKDVYQGNHEELGKRLREILLSNEENHIVALADDYGAMEGLRQENKDSIRKYMTAEKREQHYALLDMDKEYYNAYISRPYVIYPHDKVEEAGKRFEHLIRIWEKQDILFIEGDKTRMGVGNDLFINAKSIRRIIAPNENAFDVYEEIYHAAVKYGESKLILIALGPTATVLAYDLARIGYWALDIGHLDLEYEWYLKGEGYSYIPNKYNNEMLGDTNTIPIDDKEYIQSIWCRIKV